LENDLREGMLVRLALETRPVTGQGFAMHAVHRNDMPRSPAGRRFVEQLKGLR